MTPSQPRSQVSLADFTTWRVGGPAEWLAEPATIAETISLLQWARGKGLPCRVIGAGSNLLISDHWMALVKRSRDEVHGYSVNALGFAGYLLSTERSDRTWLKANGPEALLMSVVAIDP